MAAEGFYLVQGDKTTCGGKITTGAEDHTLFDKPVAREQDSVTCGKHAGLFKIAGGIDNDTIHDRRMAGTLDSYSTCPCKAKFIPSMMDDTYEKSSGASAGESAAGFAAPVQISPELPSYLTGERKPTGFVPDYPALRNTRNFPDSKLRAMLQANSQEVMLLTLGEVYEILSSWGFYKNGWVDLTQTQPGQIAVNYGLGIKDAITTTMLIADLKLYDIKSTVYVNKNGTELIKLTGYSGIRKILNAPVYALKNPKVVSLGIGKFGVKSAIVEGTVITFYFALAYRTIDFIMNDDTSLAEFIGSLATDVVKIGIASAVSWGAGALLTMTPFVIGPIVAVVLVGLGASIALNVLDDHFKVTNKLVELIENAQQEFVDKAREIEDGFWDLGAMYLDGMLRTGREFVIAETRKYLRETLQEIIPMDY
ncbi:MULTISPECIES: PAAR domain-containing protein [unclassified Serratia (in: enterobacteria)]|uniref:PAAR domain-containing protein n=1 Tax=unclassified Serratia (in: enterobacteria) TaxID=2647522 RepID=UPI002ED09F91|nr:PAAR domain-containing protein [Serratia sp. C2(2)]MEE4447185.1 PAAR domain-containing protein [Serratia sp. C2(1)]